MALLFLFFVVIVQQISASQIDQCASTCCTETISSHNQEYLNEILTVLRKRTFFRIFKVDIYKSCSLWPDNALCFKPTCSVQECCEEDIPRKWLAHDKDERNYNQGIDLFVDQQSFNQWRNVDENQWVELSNEAQMIYIDLERNPDGYTGYKGEEAGRVWRAIYEAKNLLYQGMDAGTSDSDLYATEDRVLWRLISGFHTLTNCMVFANMPLPDNPNAYGPNLQLYEKFLHGKDEWINNLYFGFVFILRAVNKASDVLSTYDVHTGNPSDDAMSIGLINYLLQTDFIQTQCNHANSFDESIMFVNKQNTKIMNNFRSVFRNISSIIDCVGCEKCKLHSKLHVLGIGTALKILFSKDTLSTDMFERNEILALIVTLGKYSDAIQFIEAMEQQIEINKLKQNMQGYVDVDNEANNQPPDREQEFNSLIRQTFENVFVDEIHCQEWKSFCQNEQDKFTQQGIEETICNLHRTHCSL